MTEQLKLVIDVVAKKGTKELRDLAKAANNVSDAADDTRTAAKRMADEFDRRTDEMVKDMQAGERAAGALADALGPELAAKIGSAKLDNFIGDLKRAGLSFEEVEADAESFAQSLRKMDAAADGVKNVEQAMQRVGVETDRSRSVFANFAGNAVQELPGMSGAFGPLNMAIGQFTEYASEGNIAIGGLLKTIGPIGAATALIAAFASVMQENAQRAEEYRRRVADLAEALRQAREDGTTAAQALAKSWQDNGGKIEAEISNDTATLLEFGEATDDMGRIHDLVYPTAKRHVEDFSDELANMGVTAEQFAALSQMSVEEIRRWGEGMVAAGFDAEEVNLIMQGAIGMHLQLADAAKADAVYLAVFGSAAGDAAGNVDGLSDAALRQRDAFRDARDKAREMRDAIDELYGIERDAIQRQEDLTEATKDLSDALGDSKASTDDQFDAAIAASEAYATLNGATLNSKEGTERQIESLQGLAASLDPKSPLRAALDKYIKQLAAIPARVDTMLALNISQGATHTKEGDLIGSRDHRASGGQVRAGAAYTVGEQGQEMFVPNTNGVIVPHGALAGGGGGGMVVNIYPRTMPTERELIDLINGIRRKQGQVI